MSDKIATFNPFEHGLNIDVWIVFVVTEFILSLFYHSMPLVRCVYLRKFSGLEMNTQDIALRILL